MAGTVRVPLLALALLAAALAGCAGDPPEPEPADDFGQELEATESTGVIRGVVIDPAIVPVPNAEVRIQDGASTTTDPDGEFGFQDLAPGSYFLQISKPGFTTTQANVNVEAGVDRPPVLKVLLEPDPTTRPSFQTFTFEGFLQCSARVTAPGLVSYGNNVCSVFDSTGQSLQEARIDYELDRVPDWVQTEMVWESTQPLGDSLQLLHSWECESNAPFFCDARATGPSPLTLASNETTIAEAGFGDTAPLIVRVFSASAEGSQEALGITFDQRFTQFTTVFYGFTPDEGWTFVEDGLPPLPE